MGLLFLKTDFGDDLVIAVLFVVLSLASLSSSSSWKWPLGMNVFWYAPWDAVKSYEFTPTSSAANAALKLSYWLCTWSCPADGLVSWEECISLASQIYVELRILTVVESREVYDNRWEVSADLATI
jgi:hypothetical protein